MTAENTKNVKADTVNDRWVHAAQGKHTEILTCFLPLPPTSASPAVQPEPVGTELNANFFGTSVYLSSSFLSSSFLRPLRPTHVLFLKVPWIHAILVRTQ